MYQLRQFMLQAALSVGSSPLLRETGSQRSGLGRCQVRLGTKYGKLSIFGTFKFLNFRKTDLTMT